MSISIIKVRIKYEEDTVLARRRARQIAGLLKFEMREQTAIATAVSEIVRNAFMYGEGGSVEFYLDDKATPQVFYSKISDSGPGIKNLQEVLEGRYVSSTGMGLGITGSRKLMDSFEISSSPEQGTTVILGKKMSPGKERIGPGEINQITGELMNQEPGNPMEEIQQQNQELLNTLEEIRKKQEDLVRLNVELEETNRGVVALYAELDEKANHLKSLNEMQARFLSNMSHEFKTPLSSIMALSRLLLDHVDGQLSEEQTRQVTYIKRSTSELSELVNDLLDIAKVESGKITVKPDEFKIAGLFTVLRGMLRPLMTNPGVNLIFENAENLPSMFNDEGKVSQILRNFISNALKFTVQGEIRVKAEVSRDEKSIVFSVSDTGIGIAPKDQEIIFEEFGQVDSDLQKKVKGTGLGLPLSKRFAELLGGSVHVESSFGVGSTFYATIPMHYIPVKNREKERVETRRLEKNIYKEPQIPQSSELTKILIVDDDEISRYVLKGILSDSNYIVLEADNGTTGIKKASEERPDLIFLDIIMPDITGFEVLTKLKSEILAKDIPVIISTSKTLNEKEIRELDPSAAEIISKQNISGDIVINKIAGILNKSTKKKSGH